MKTSDFNYTLPQELIAQAPLPKRSASRMMVVHRDSGVIEHRHITDLSDYLNRGDLLVLNNTRVIPARIFGHKVDTGGKVELLLVERVGAHNSVSSMQGAEWIVLCRAGWKPRPGILLSLAQDNIQAEILESYGYGKVRIRFSCNLPLEDILEKHGVPPVPPYIKRDYSECDLVDMDRKRYQTIYASESGAVAAPTAGLHFSDELFAELSEHGVKTAEITLHVGPGTFKPVKTEQVEDHVMESERYLVSEKSACLINDAKKEGGRIVAVGSTSVRTLETIAGPSTGLRAEEGRSSLFIRPPYEFKIVDVMLTNFHLPESTLLMMVSALAGVDLINCAYKEAIKGKYRFYSYGDCMLIL
ncbi:MAG: tRNA preQ1(34) S-adenosylmethionine ribosyltransferase-isomerase QueA [Kiritimatiellae bacterium]|nr:tRNA preQ1(34) S-adenosylmethionine ribosyltransferase-isomerase QueA [Kiritimatiellia bacterium]